MEKPRNKPDVSEAKSHVGYLQTTEWFSKLDTYMPIVFP